MVARSVAAGVCRSAAVSAVKPSDAIPTMRRRRSMGNGYLSGSRALDAFQDLARAGGPIARPSTQRVEPRARLGNATRAVVGERAVPLNLRRERGIGERRGLLQVSDRAGRVVLEQAGDAAVVEHLDRARIPRFEGAEFAIGPRIVVLAEGIDGRL